MTQLEIPCSLMRGGTSKGLYFLASDLPSSVAERDRILIAAMGAYEPRQIDGVGGADPLTSKVAIVGPSSRPDADIDYLFLQVGPDRPIVSAKQNCGNILAGVVPFAIERGLVAARDGRTEVTVHMVNSGGRVAVTAETPGGATTYAGNACIDGVPGRHAPVRLFFMDTAGSACGALLPSAQSVDRIDDVRCTLIDNGMPVVVMPAADLGLAGDESAAAFDAPVLRDRLEAIRLEAGRRMGLGDVSDATVPKLTLVSAPGAGGLIRTRTLTPHRLHSSIGVLGAVSVATACLLPDTPAATLVDPAQVDAGVFAIEHPTGQLSLEIDSTPGAPLAEARIGVLRTARLLMRGQVMVPETAA